MNFKELSFSISQNYRMEIPKITSDIAIDNIILLCDSIKNWSPSSLYVGSSSFLPPQATCPIQAIICDSASKLNHELFSNLAIINSFDMNSIFNQLSYSLYQSLRLSADFSQLVAMVLRGDSVTSVLNLAASQLGNPLIVVDTSYHVLSYSDKHKISDPFWLENIKRGYSTYEFIASINEILTNLDALNDSSSFIVTCPATPKSKLCAEIFWNDFLIGYIIMLEEDNTLQPYHKELLPKISYIVGDMLSKSPEFENIKGSNYEHILYNILNGEDEYNLAARIEAAKLTFPDIMRCILIKPKNISDTIKKKADRTATLKLCKERLSSVFPINYFTYYNENIVFVIKVLPNHKFNAKQEATLNELFERGISTISISQAFDTIYKLPDNYKSCQVLQQIAHSSSLSKQLMYYEDYIFEALINNSMLSYEISSYVHPALEILRNYDLQTDNSLYQTLHVYLSTKYNLKKTSELLFIHRNSLSYRMEKIITLTNISLEDSNTLFWLELSFKIEKMISGVM